MLLEPYPYTPNPKPNSSSSIADKKKKGTAEPKGLVASEHPWLGKTNLSRERTRENRLCRIICIRAKENKPFKPSGSE